MLMKPRYINDLPGIIENSEIYLYADDTNIFKDVNTIEDCKHLQDLQNMEKWSQN